MGGEMEVEGTGLEGINLRLEILAQQRDTGTRAQG
jgi:hypothetical protein